MTSTQKELDAIQKRADSATPGKWGFARGDRQSGQPPHIVRLSDDGAAAGEFIGQIGPHTSKRDTPKQVYDNATFIAHARQDVPALLELVKELEASRSAFIEAGEMLADENVDYKEALDDIGSATREWVEKNGAYRLVERANMALAGEKTSSRLNGEGE